MSAKKGQRVLFIGSGPYRVSRETRGNLFAHSCLAAMRDMGIDYAVLDNDASGPLCGDTPKGQYYTGPFDADMVRSVVKSVKPTHIWPVCAGKEVQALLLDLFPESPLLAGGFQAYKAAVDWGRFRELASSRGIDVPFGSVAASVEEAAAVAGKVGFPVFLSTSQSKGGPGARIVYNYEELAAEAQKMLSWSLAGNVLVVAVHEKHPHCEVHVIADSQGKAVVLGIVDAIAPLGVHIGNCATVFPAQSLSPAATGKLHDAALALAEGCGLAGYGVFHFGVNADAPYAVGMRVGFASTSYNVALGLRLDIARLATEVAFGKKCADVLPAVPSPGSLAVSVPHFDNESFPGAGNVLGPYKISTGMGAGCAPHFAGAFLAAERSARSSLTPIIEDASARARQRDVLPALAAPRVDFLTDLVAAIARGHSFEEICAASGVSRIYIEELARLLRLYQDVKRSASGAATAATDAGFTPSEIALAAGKPPAVPRAAAHKPSPASPEGAFVIVAPPARAVGCVDESDVILRGLARAFTAKGRPLIIVGWRSRQAIDIYLSAEKVYCGDADETLRMVLSSTPVSAVYVDPRNPSWDALSREVTSRAIPLVSAEPDLVAALADRKTLSGVLPRAGLMLKEGQEVSGLEQARRAAAEFGYPVLVRPKGTAHTFVVAYDESQLADSFADDSTMVVERFLEDLVETAVVVLADGVSAHTVAVIEVLEEPGISSIDRAGVLPPFSITEKASRLLSSRAETLVTALGAKGIVTLRLGLRYDVPYYLSATVGAAREVPFAAAALGFDIVSAAASIFSGASLNEALPAALAPASSIYIRQPVFSFGRFPGADTVLGTLPRSTGDVVGIGPNFALAYAAARSSTGRSLPSGGTVFISLRDRDKRTGMLIGRQLADLGFKIVATEGTARALASAGVAARVVYRVSEGRPNVVDLLKNREITMVIYTPSGRAPREDEVQIRTVAWSLGTPVITAAGEALAAVGAIEALKVR